MLLHSKRQCDQPPHDQPGIERADTGSQVNDAVFTDISEQFAGSHDRSSQCIAMAIQILGGTVNDNIGPMLDWVLGNQSRPGAVHDHDGPDFMCQTCYFFDVADEHHWIAGGFDQHGPGFRADRRTHGLEVGCVHKCCLDAEAGQVFTQKFLGAGVANLGSHHVVP